GGEALADVYLFQHGAFVLVLGDDESAGLPHPETRLCGKAYPLAPGCAGVLARLPGVCREARVSEVSHRGPGDGRGPIDDDYAKAAPQGGDRVAEADNASPDHGEIVRSAHLSARRI